MGNAKRFPYILTAEDIVDTEIEVRAGRVVGFAMNYRAHIRGIWREVLRYDTRHGALHVHRFWLPENTQVRKLTRTVDEPADYRDWFARLKADLDKNWKAYRRNLEGRVP